MSELNASFKLSNEDLAGLIPPRHINDPFGLFPRDALESVVGELIESNVPAGAARRIIDALYLAARCAASVGEAHGQQSGYDVGYSAGSGWQS